MKRTIRKIGQRFLEFFYPNLKFLRDGRVNYSGISSVFHQSEKGKHTLLYPNYSISNSSIGDYTYIAQNTQISLTDIGKFCSVGPNFLCGWGIHPTNGLSTAPMFYSTMKQNGMTLSDTNKIEERRRIKIGNDVFIGANVTVLDGVTIGDGAIIGAGAVVSKDIPAFAIAIGCPIAIKSYRFHEKQREAFKKIKWWDFNEEKLKDVEKLFFEIDLFLEKYKEQE